MSPLQFYMSSSVSFSDKCLEVMYFIIGFISVYVAFKNLMDKENKHNVGTFLFWFVFGILFAFGKWLPSFVDGILLFVLVIPPIFHKVSMGNSIIPTMEEMDHNFKKIGLKIFVPAFSIGAFALIAAFCTDISPLVGMSVGVFVAIFILMLYSKENKPKVFLNDCRRMIDIVGPISMLPMLLAALGSLFTAAGVGDVLSNLVSYIIPEGNVVIGVVIYAFAMVIFTMIMGSAFGAITVITVGIGAPFVLKYGLDPVVIGSLALTCGYCGTLCTPMGANYNLVPVAVLEMKDQYGVIKNQILIAIVMLVVQIAFMLVEG